MGNNKRKTSVESGLYRSDRVEGTLRPRVVRVVCDTLLSLLRGYAAPLKSNTLSILLLHETAQVLVGVALPPRCRYGQHVSWVTGSTANASHRDVTGVFRLPRLVPLKTSKLPGNEMSSGQVINASLSTQQRPNMSLLDISPVHMIRMDYVIEGQLRNDGR